MTQMTFPPLPLADWQSTRDTVTHYAKIAGKIRRALTPPQKHWWHVSLRAAACGLTTTPMSAGNKTAEIVLDFAAHQLLITTSHNERYTTPLQWQSPMALAAEALDALAAFGITPEIDQSQFDDAPGSYDETAVTHFWRALAQIDAVFKEFKGGFREESSPVQLWPHHFDLAVLWFSGRLVPGVDPDDVENADEQMNFGFSTGDSSIPDAYFYATAYPTPDNLTEQPLPPGVYWHTSGFTGAILPYELLVTADDPHNTLLTFLRTAHQAGKTTMIG